MKSPEFDPIVVDAALVNYEKLIEQALKSKERGKWIMISKIARMAGSLEAVVGPRKRVGDFDQDQALRREDIEADAQNEMMGQDFFNPPGMNMGRIGVAGGETMEMMRQMIDGFTSVQQAPRRLPASDEINVLLDAKKKSKDMMEDTKEIDERLSVLRKELNNAVVSTNVLRGHQAQASVGQGNHRFLGEVDAHREEGNGSSDGEGSGQEVDAR